MKKILYIIIGIVLIAGSLIYWQHLHNECEWTKWRIQAMEIREQAYQKEKSFGWSQEETEEYIKKELDERGLKKPGYCIYCSMLSSK